MGKTTFIDKVRLKIEGGAGGAGALSFRREKYVEFGGPDGGNGGDGGSVVLEADYGAKTLYDLSYRPKIQAEPGNPGAGARKTGRSGKDVVLKVPVGTVVYREGYPVADLRRHRERVIVARGGRGGRGNASFKSNRLKAPRIAEKGGPGERLEIRLELKMIADVGLVGFPNAGKSTMLSRLTRARPKIAGYPFTTLRPNLGLVEKGGRAFVLADIPGLIEGAHEGKGLGHDFLRHVERTRLLIHLVDPFETRGKDALADVRAIEAELKSFSPKLARKRRVLVVNKADLPQAKEVVARLKRSRRAAKIFLVSAVTGEGLDSLLKEVFKLLRSIPESDPIEIKRPPDWNPEAKRRDKQGFSVFKLAPHAFELRGEGVERMVSMTDFAHRDARMRLQKQLKKIGVDRAMRKAGVADGDAVRIGERELEWFFEEPAHDRVVARRRKRKKII